MSRKARISLVQFVTFCFLNFFLSLSQAEVTLTIGKGSGDPGATDSQVAVSLENQDDQARAVQVDICDVDDYLTCTACETADRTADFMCLTNELTNGCCKIMLFSLSADIIEVGEGAIFALNYDVSNEAPSGCRELTAENVSVADENNQPLVVITEPGGFCFPCTSQADCDDGLYCDGIEICVDGNCQPGVDPCLSGDEVCDERDDVCLEACEYDTDCADDNPCTTDSCHQAGYCQYDLLSNGSPCEDGLFCNGAETCDASGVCQPGTDPCPGQECDETLHCVDCLTNDDCADGNFCNGAETCDASGVCQPGTDPCPGQECDETLHCIDCLTDDDCDDPTPLCNDSIHTCVECLTDADCDDTSFCNDGACEPIAITTTTTTTPVTTTIPPPPTTSTTTTAIPHSYKVTISPSSATLDSGEKVQFSAKTTDNGEEVAGTYDWEIYPASTIGSEIDDEGLFTSGDNTTDSEIGETVRVTDTDHENISATATVTIKVKIEPPPECEVAINPSSATVSSGEASHLEAETTGDGCLAGDYEWFIDSEIESIIDQEGNYNAGINNTGSHVTDEITVVDHANADITGSATIIVENKIVSVCPDKLLGSRWIPLIYLLLIEGEDTYFKLSSTIEFEPGGDILELGHLGLGDIFLALLFLDANPQEGTVNIIINNDGEVVTGKVTIELLPSPFAEDYSSSAESYREISFDAATLSDNHSIEKNSL